MDYVEALISNENSFILINGLCLLAYFANTYPTEYMFDRILANIKYLKNLDLLKKLFTTNEKVYLFMEALFNLSKAFPKKNDYLLDYLLFLRENIETISTDCDISNSSKIMIEKTKNFIGFYIINLNFSNNNVNSMQVNI